MRPSASECASVNRVGVPGSGASAMRDGDRNSRPSPQPSFGRSPPNRDPVANRPTPCPGVVASSSVAPMPSIASASCQPSTKWRPAGLAATDSASCSPAMPVVGRLMPAVGSSA